MTKFGKCDTCRQRKIKCDERHPVCGGCKKKSRPCTYTYVKVTALADGGLEYEPGRDSLVPSAPDADAAAAAPGLHLRLRSTQTTRNGDGLLQTFTLHRQANGSATLKRPKPAPSGGKGAAESDDQDLVEQPLLFQKPSNESTQRLGRWGNMVASLSRHYGTPYPLGVWMEAIPVRIGHSSSLDAAIDCFIQSIMLSANNTLENQVLADSLNMKALRHIRGVVGSPQTATSDALLAICLLTFVEFFVRATTGGYKFHITGLLDLIKNTAKGGKLHNEVVTYLVDTCYSWDCIPAMLQGRDSIFDDPIWLDFDMPSISEINQPGFSLFRCIFPLMRVYWTQLPRLLRLTRAALDAPKDIGLQQKAVKHALLLYSQNIDNIILECFNTNHVTIDLTVSTKFRAYLSHYLNFSTYNLHSLLSNYWATRSLICGILINLTDTLSLNPSFYLFDYDEVVAADMQCAEYLLMSMEYGSKARFPLPLVDTRVALSLNAVYMTFNRLEGRSGGPQGTSPDAERARKIKVFCSFMLQDQEPGASCSGYSPEIIRYRQGILTGLPFSQIAKPGTYTPSLPINT